jgi:hypothetical protein
MSLREEATISDVTLLVGDDNKVAKANFCNPFIFAEYLIRKKEKGMRSL